MKTRLITFTLLCLLVMGKAHAQWTVFDPSNLVQSIMNSTKEVVQASSTAANMANNFAETVKIYKQGKEFYDALKSVNNLVKDARKVQKTVLMIGEISDIYVNSYQKMLSDENYTPAELSAIAYGYTKLLEESTDIFTELKQAVSATGLSMSDKERMDLVDLAYTRVEYYRNLVSYYTRKNISVSYVRSKKKNEIKRIVALYGSANEKYW